MAMKKCTADAASTKKSPMKSSRDAASTKKATAPKGAIASAMKKWRAADKETKRADATKSNAAPWKTRKENEEARVAAYVSAQLFQLNSGRSVQSGASQHRKT